MEEMTKHEKIERAHQIADEAVDKLTDYFESRESTNDAKKAYLAALDLIWAVSFMREMLEETTNETKEIEEA